MIDLSKEVTVRIGRCGEHHYRNIEFDVTSLLEDNYPVAALNAIYKRPDGIAYPVVTSYADGVLTWSPSATDTLLVGVGRLEIRVTYGEVVGKSVRIFTIVEEALKDDIATPPEPPAQEWLNQVLSALAALDINSVFSLLTLTYNLLEDNYTLLNATHSLLADNYDLLNTTHDLLSDTRNMLSTRTGILLNHWHPIETATAPDMASRRASITFTNIANGNNVVLGTVTYTFVTSLGSPAANNVQVLIQGTLRGSVKKLATWKRRTHTSGMTKYYTYTCNTHLKDKSKCGQLFIRETDFEVAFINMMNKLIFSKKVLLQPYLNSLKSINQANALTRINELETTMEQNFDRRQVLTNLLSKQYIEPALYAKQNSELLAEAEALKNEKDTLFQSVNGELENAEAVSWLLKYLNNSTGFTEFDAEAFEAHVDHIIVYSRREIGLVLKCGLNLKERL